MGRRPDSYPWSRWLRRGDSGKLTRGKDFRCQPGDFAQLLREAAVRERHLIAETRIEGDTVHWHLRKPLYV